MKMDYSSLPTPPACVADFCLIPIGTPTASVSKEVADVQRLMKASGLSYSMHSAGTTLEGSWDDVMRVIGQAHTLVHKNGVLRVQTDIRAGTRTDKQQHFSEKVSKVESLLANDSKTAATPAQEFPKRVDAEGNEGHISGTGTVDAQTSKAKSSAPVAGSTPTAPVSVEAGKSEPAPKTPGPDVHKGTWASMFKK